MIEFTVVEHRCGLKVNSVILQADDRAGTIIYETGLLANLPALGDKFVLLPANLPVEDVNQSETYKSAIRITEANL